MTLAGTAEFQVSQRTPPATTARLDHISNTPTTSRRPNATVVRLAMHVKALRIKVRCSIRSSFPAGLRELCIQKRTPIRNSMWKSLEIRRNQGIMRESPQKPRRIERSSYVLCKGSWVRAESHATYGDRTHHGSTRARKCRSRLSVAHLTPKHIRPRTALTRFAAEKTERIHMPSGVYGGRYA